MSDKFPKSESSETFPETVPSILSTAFSQRQLSFPSTKGWKKKRKPQPLGPAAVAKTSHANPRCPFENCNLCRKTHGATQ